MNDQPDSQPDTELESPVTPAKPAPTGAESSNTVKAKKPHGLKAFWTWARTTWWHAALVGIVILLLVGGGVTAATDLKYTVAGPFVQGTATVAVTDARTSQPVPSAQIEFGGKTGVTDKDGRITLKGLRPGHSKLKVHKTGYDNASQDALVPLLKAAKLTIKLKPNGVTVTASVRNVITAGIVAGVEVRSGEASAITDDEGIAKLSLPINTTDTSQTLTFERDGYNKQSVSTVVKAGAAPLETKLVPTGKVYFQSNRTGKIDIYESNLDGSGAKIILAATGLEDAATGILPSINDPHTLALVSSRAGRRGTGLHHDLFSFNTESQKLTKIDDDIEFTNYRAWVGDGLVYAKSTYSPYYGNCDSIKTFQPSTGKTSTLFSAEPGERGCASITVAFGDSFIYSVARGGEGTAGLFSAKFAASVKRISNTPSDQATRKTKQAILSEYYQTDKQVWDSVSLSNFSVTRLPNGPSDESSRFYNDSPDGSLKSFIEERDGKSELYVADGDGNNEKKITNIGSTNQFVQWYSNDYVVFSSTRTDENALYVVAVKGGMPVKIADFYRGNQRTYGGGGNSYY